MSERNYYVLCDDNCKFPAMTKEQTLAAIEQAANDGRITNVDAGFITKIKEQNKQSGLMFWVGTYAEYNAIKEKISDCFYIITDEADPVEYIIELQDQVNIINQELSKKFRVLFNTETIRPQGSEITIPNAKLYNHFELYVTTSLIDMGDEGITTPIYAIRHGNYIHGNGVFVPSLDSGKTPIHFYFSATTRDVSTEEENKNAEIWTIETLSYMAHVPSDSHAFISNDVNLIEVVGVI